MVWSSSATGLDRADTPMGSGTAAPLRSAALNVRLSAQADGRAQADDLQGSEPISAHISAEGKLTSEAMRVLDAATQMAMAQTANPTAAATLSSLSIVIGIDTLDIEAGSWSGPQSTFVPNPNWPKASVNIGEKDASLERVRDKINAAGIGVVAVVVSDATGSRLVLRPTSTAMAAARHSESRTVEQADAGKPAASADTAISAAGAAFHSKLLAQYTPASGQSDQPDLNDMHETTVAMSSNKG